MPRLTRLPSFAVPMRPSHVVDTHPGVREFPLVWLSPTLPELPRVLRVRPVAVWLWTFVRISPMVSLSLEGSLLRVLLFARLRAWFLTCLGMQQPLDPDSRLASLSWTSGRLHTTHAWWCNALLENLLGQSCAWAPVGFKLVDGSGHPAADAVLLHVENRCYLMGSGQSLR